MIKKLINSIKSAIPKKDNLPIGLQIIAPHLKDQLLLSVSKELI
jgi:Asp-tRNA(Asn)/Glu-tRNA(Gln) amidotransferase A subunit family amidase